LIFAANGGDEMVVRYRRTLANCDERALVGPAETTLDTIMMRFQNLTEDTFWLYQHQYQQAEISVWKYADSRPTRSAEYSRTHLRPW